MGCKTLTQLISPEGKYVIGFILALRCLYMQWKLIDDATHVVVMQGIKDLMEGMKDKEALIHIRNTNHERLLMELERLVVCSIFSNLHIVNNLLLDIFILIS